MKFFIFLSLGFVVCCWTRPNVNDYLPPEREQLKLATNEAKSINEETPATSLSSISLHNTKNRHAQIESIQPSIHLASFSIQTTVPVSQTYSQQEQSYSQPAEYQPTQQVIQPQIKGSYNYNTAPISTQQTYSYAPSAVISQQYEPSTAIQHQNFAKTISVQNYRPSSPIQQNYAPQETYTSPTAVYQNYAGSYQQQTFAMEQRKVPQEAQNPAQTYLQPAAAQQNYAAPIQQQTASVEQAKSTQITSQQPYNTAQNPPQSYLQPAATQQNYAAPIQQQQTTTMEQRKAPQETGQQYYNIPQNPAQTYLPSTAAHQNYAASVQQQTETLPQATSVEQTKSTQITSQQSHNTALSPPQTYLQPVATQQSYAAPIQQQQTASIEQRMTPQETSQQSYNTAPNPSQTYLPPAATQQNYAAAIQQQKITLSQTASAEQTKPTQITSHQTYNSARNPPQTYFPPTATHQEYAAPPQQQPSSLSQLYVPPQTVSVKSTNVHQVPSPQFYNTAANPSRIYLTPAVQQNYIAPPQQQSVTQHPAAELTHRFDYYSPSQPNTPVQQIFLQSPAQTTTFSAPYNYQPSTQNNLKSVYATPTGSSNYNPATNSNAQIYQLPQQANSALVQSIPKMPIATSSYNYNTTLTTYAAPITVPKVHTAPLQQTQPVGTQAVVKHQTQTVTNQNYASTTANSYNYNNSPPATNQYQQPPSNVPAQNGGSYRYDLLSSAPSSIQTSQPIQASGIQPNQPLQDPAAISFNYRESSNSHFQTTPETPASQASTQNNGSYNYHASSVAQQKTESNHLHETQPVQKIELSISSASAPFLTEVRSPQDTEYDHNGGYIYRRH